MWNGSSSICHSVDVGRHIQHVDPFIEEHNSLLEQRTDMRAYREQQRNGLLGAALGPPERPLRQVPQILYTAGQRACRDIASIEFFTSERKGIRLIDAYGQNWGELCDSTDRLWLSHCHKTNIRLKIYTEGDKYKPFHRAVPSCRSTVPPENLERRIIAFNVSKVIKEYMNRTDGQWNLDRVGKIVFEDLILLELRYVSGGSWQPVLAFYDPTFI